MHHLRFTTPQGRSFMALEDPVAHLPRKTLYDTHTKEHVSKCPVTVMWLEGDVGEDPNSCDTRTGEKWPAFEKEKARMLETDDVINDAFFEHVILCSPNDHRSASPGPFNTGPVGSSGWIISTPTAVDGALPDDLCRSAAHHISNDWRRHDSQEESLLRPGPYLFYNGALYRVCRLYKDIYSAFVFGVKPGKMGRTHSMMEEEEEELDLVPVPSRLYYDPPCEKFPIRGQRVAIKDLFHLAGAPTSAGNRDFQQFLGGGSDNDRQSEMVSRLVDAGAVIVGKTKTAQFGSGEHACDWVDYSCPYNPRGGDGEWSLEPDCSSTGSASAVAGYGWLDFSVGTDTLGSVLGPAAVQAIFGIRPSHGLADMGQVVPVSKHLDTAGVFARSITDLRIFCSSWYRLGSQDATKKPNKLLYPVEEFHKFPEDKQRVMRLFIDDVERVTALKGTPFNISETWRSGQQYKEDSRDIEDYLETTLAHIQLHDSYQNNLPFRTSFRERYRREPRVNPMIEYKWNLGSKITTHQYEEALEQRAVYRDFLREQVFGNNDNSTVMVLPGGYPELRYREQKDDLTFEERGNTLQGFGLKRDAYSFLGGLPQVVVPVDTVRRVSPSTGLSIEHPVSVSFVGAEGTDASLMAFVESVLGECGRRMSVKAGNDM